MPISSSRDRLTLSRAALDTAETKQHGHGHDGAVKAKEAIKSHISVSRDREATKTHHAHQGPVKSKETTKPIERVNSRDVNINPYAGPPVKSKESIKPRRVTLPHIERLKLQNDNVGRSLSHGSAVNHHRPYRHHAYEKPKSVHHRDHHSGYQDNPKNAKSTHHPAQHSAAHSHKKRRPKKEKEGDDITLKKIKFFSSHPAPAPLTICLPYPGVELTHKELLDAIQSLGTIDADDIQSIQFIDMNCILGTAGIDNRWLITVKDFDTRYLLMRDVLWINDDPLHFRLLDDVNMEDYKEYRRRMATLESDAHVSAVERLLAMHNQIM